MSANNDFDDFVSFCVVLLFMSLLLIKSGGDYDFPQAGFALGFHAFRLKMGDNCMNFPLLYHHARNKSSEKTEKD